MRLSSVTISVPAPRRGCGATDGRAVRHHAPDPPEVKLSTLTRQSLQGTWGCPLLPLRSDDSIDWNRLASTLHYLASADLDGLYVHGSAGEFHCLEEWEFDRINEAIAEQCLTARIPFQIGASHMSAQISLSRVGRAVQWRPSAIQVILPDWVPISMPESIDFLKRIADRAAGIPLVLYNPPQAKTRLLPAQFGQLAEAIPTLIGVKVAGGDASWYEQMRQHAGGLALFVAGHALATGHIHGARGAYSNVACLAPRTASKWYRQMQTDGAAALVIERRLQDFIGSHVAPLQRDGYSNAALDKLLAYVGGWSETGIRTRWPHRWIPEPVAARIRDAAQQEIPDLLD